MISIRSLPRLLFTRGREGRRRDPLMVVGIAFLVILALVAILGPLVREGMIRPSGNKPFDPVIDSVALPYAPPDGHLWFGTDDLGRDIFSRIAAGARVSLFVGLAVQCFALTVGIFVGVVGAYAPPWIATPLMRFTDGMFAFPDILLAILIIGIIGQGLVPVIVALSITAWPAIARLVRSQVATLKDREYVVAAKASGASTWYLVMRHVLPQLAGVLLAVSMIEVAGTILSESALSFLGIGVQPPQPSWGSMIRNARDDMTSHPIALLWPCLVLSLTIFALNFVGDGVRAAMDPKRG